MSSSYIVVYTHHVYIVYYRHPRFVQGTQEDSHEVLRALLDDIKNEEIAVSRLSLEHTYLKILAMYSVIVVHCTDCTIESMNM